MQVPASLVLTALFALENVMPLAPENMPQTAVVGTRPLLGFVGNDELVRKEQEEEARREAEKAQAMPPILSIGSHIRGCWEKARSAKDQDITPRLLNCERLRKGKYDSITKARITKRGGTDLFINLTNNRCRSAQSWLKDVLLPPGEKPWATDPTPVPELPAHIEQNIARQIQRQYHEAILLSLELKGGQEIDEETIKEQVGEQGERLKADILKGLQKEAARGAKAIETEIDDDLVEGGWYQAMDDILYDVITFPTAFMKGPVVRKVKTLKWEGGRPVVVDALQRQFERVSGFDTYPAPGAKKLQDDYLIERHRLTRSSLNALIGVSGYDEPSIRLVLQQYGAGGLKDWLWSDSERAVLENRPQEQTYGDTIDALQFWGPIQGTKLLMWGMSRDEIPDADIDYHVTAWLIGNIVISARLNPHPLGRRPYYSTSYEPCNDSIWGKGIPELMEDIQKICNACARAMVNNMGLSSGPLVWVLYDMLKAGQSVETLSPWKIYEFSSESMMQGKPPMGFFQPQSNIEVLLKLYDYFFKQASEVTGIPAYVYGSTQMTGGAARTATGLSMLMNAASKGLKAVAGNVDKGIIKPSIEEYWFHIMLHEPEKATGDIKIVARASEYLIMMEQLQIRRTEFLNSTANEYDMQIIGLAGRAEVLRETARGLKMDTDKIVPNPEDLEQRTQEMQKQVWVNNLAQNLGISPDDIIQLATMSGGSQGGGAMTTGRSLQEDGSPAGGQENALQ